MIIRLLRVVLLLIWFDVGLALILLPWSHSWELNPILSSYPGLIHILMNPYLRGAISGLGFVDAILAIEAFRQGAPVASQS